MTQAEPLEADELGGGPGLPPVLRRSSTAIAVAQAYADRVGPGAAARDVAGGVPWAELEILDRTGLLGITLPASLDGPELPWSTVAEVVRTIAAVDPAIAQLLQPHFLFPIVVWEIGGPEARRALSEWILAGGRGGNAAAEKGGPHAQDLRTRITRAADGSYRLNGTKYYSTGAVSSAWIAVSAIDEDEQQVFVFTQRDADGVQVGDDWAAMGQRNTTSGTSVFTDVVIDEAFVLPYWQLFEGPQTFGARAQLIHAAIEVGVAGGALRDAGQFLHEKARPFFEAVRGGYTETAAGDPHTIYRFGQLSTRVAAAEALLVQAGAVVDETEARPADPEAAARASVAVAQAKAFGSEVAVEVASELFAVTGTSATDEKYNLNRHWRNARTHSVHDPVSWKYHHIGAFAIDGTLPPNHGQL